MTTDVIQHSAEQAARALQAHLDPSRVLVSGPDYDAATQIWNGAVQHRPAVVARCRSAADVQAAVRVARDHGLAVSVRGGGHDWAGRALRHDGLVIDLTGMRGVTVEGRVAVVAGGATADDLIGATEPHGLVAATGNVGAVGMTGFTLGGGYGPLGGLAGLGVDNLLGADVVLADGRLVSTDDTHEPELFWGLRGGGGNFGVVTAMRIRLHPVTEVTTGFLMFSWAQASVVMSGLAGLIVRSPDELTVQSGMVPGPDGSPVFYLSPTWSGAPEDGAGWIEELRGLGTAVVDRIAPMPYSAMLVMWGGLVENGRHYALRTRTVAALTSDVTAAIAAAGETRTSPHSAIVITHFHGSPTRVPVGSTAFGLRTEHQVVEIIAAWEPGDGAPHRAWADDVATALEPHSLPGGYANLIGPDEPEQTADAYGENADRLLDAKARYDPDGVFSAISLPQRVPG